ncbi:MAG: hypothetical protein ABSD46_08020 [Bacteroidota bacterium]
MKLIAQPNASPNQIIPDTSRKVDSTFAISTTDSSKGKQDGQTLLQNMSKVDITVQPEEARDAEILILQKIDIEKKIGNDITIMTSNDTLDRQAAPLSTYLSFGDYNFVAKKKGFKDAVKTVLLRDASEYYISIDMIALSYLQNKREEWGIYKWICAAVAVGAGAATYYFHEKIQTYKNDYDNSTSAAMAQEKRDNITKYQGYYKLSSAITFTFIGGFGISWRIQSSY